MSELPWMPVYIGTETALTGHLSPEEFGCYERLRRHWWQHGSLPEDDTRLMRITGVDPHRWEDIAKAIGPLMSDSIRKLEDERSGAAAKREKKVAAGVRGAAARWRTHGKAIADANGTTMADASEEMANASFCQWPSASPSESSLREEKEERLALMRAREPNVMSMSMAEAEEHLRKTGRLVDDNEPANSYAARSRGE